MQQAGHFDASRIVPLGLDLPWPSEKGPRASRRRVLSQVAKAEREQLNAATDEMPLGSSYCGSQVSFLSAVQFIYDRDVAFALIMITLPHKANRHLCHFGLPFFPQPFLCFQYHTVSNVGPTFLLIREWLVPFSPLESEAESYSNMPGSL